MNKKIVTYSWLLKKAMAILKKDPDEYHKLITLGSDKVLTGLNVMLNLNTYSGNCQSFYLRVPAKAENWNYCAVHGNSRGGKHYSYYEFMFTATQYRKRITEKYLPITLPEGVRSVHNDKGSMTTCIFHNADGSEAERGLWHGGRRGRQGRPDRYVAICDNTGQLVSQEEFQRESLSRSDEDTQVSHNFFHAASRTRSEWLKSFQKLSGMVDMGNMMTLGARSYLAASRFCERYPNVKMALFPAGSASYMIGGGETAQVEEPGDKLQQLRYRHRQTEASVLSRDPNNNWAGLWHLPEVLLYWTDKRYGMAKPFASFLSFQIPPHGNPLLDPTGGMATSAQTRRSPVNFNARDRAVSGLTMYQVLERAHHSIPAFDPATPLQNRQSYSKYWSFAKYGEKHMYSEQDKHLVLWQKHTDKVRVMYFTDLAGDDRGYLMPENVGLAMKPDDVISFIEEKFLLESLPLC